MNVAELKRKAVWISWFTIFYNIIEGLISIGFGWSDDSISLLGFGIDSFVESASAAIVLWRLRGEIDPSSHLSIHRERTATFAIGILFLILGTSTLLASSIKGLQRSQPETTIPGTIIALISLSFMFALWTAKKKIGTALSSSTILKDAACSLACIKLSVVLLLGSLLYVLVPGLWWTDAVAGLILSILILKEGWETIQAAKKEDFTGGCGCSE